MIRFFTNRELSERLEINLARWKRWSREFIPPDPLGGMQSGYARQYNPDEAFNVHLGGHLVSDLKFTMPEAKQILKDLQWWLEDKGCYFKVKGNAVPQNGVEDLVKKYIVFIGQERFPDKTFKLHYTVRGVISNRPVRYRSFEIMEELYAETQIGSQPDAPAPYGADTVKTLNITGVLNNFVARMDLNRVHYPALSNVS